MNQRIVNRIEGCNVEGDYVGGNQTNKFYNIIMLQESEREFVVTHNANIKSVAYFTGRETELKELRQRIEEGRKSVLVSGMGGIGKTHICRKLFEEYLIKHNNSESGFFRHIGYVEYNGDMSDSLSKCLKYKKQDTPELDKEAAWEELEHLASDGKLLLFVDNVNVAIGDDPELKRLMDIPGAIVLTSRRRTFSKEFESYPIGFLSIEQCREIYERIRFEDSGKRVAEEEVPDLEYVIEKLAAMHTITVEFLAHLARTKCWAVQRLRDELDRNKFRLEYKDEEDKLVNIQESYEKLYDMSKLNGAEQNILEAFSLFPYIPLGAQTCNEWLLMDAGVSEDDDILTGLYQKGWLQFDLSEEGYALHPVFAQFIYEKCKPVIERHVGLIRSCRMCFKALDSSFLLENQQLILFAENIAEKLSMETKIEYAGFISAIAHLRYYTAEYKKAEELYEKSLRIREKVLGEEHMDTAASYNGLATVYVKQGEYGKAKKLYEKSLGIREKVLGEEHMDTAESYNNLAGLYAMLGEYKGAEELYVKSLRVNEKLLGEEHLKTAIGRNNLAGVYVKQGKYERAKKLYEKSLGIREKVLGEEHMDTAESYNNLAGLYVALGEYKGAEGLYVKSLRVSEKLLGEEHLKTAIGRNNLAGVYVKQGEYERAKELYEKTLRIIEKVLGEEHPETATGYHNLAYVYSVQREYGEAERLYEKSMGIRKKVLGEEHLDTAESYNSLAGTYNKQGEYRKAKELYVKSLWIREKVLGEEHPDTATSYNNLAGIYMKQGKYEKAEKLYEKSLRIREKVLGKEHPDTAGSYHNLAGMYERMGKYGKAEELYEKSLRIRERVLGKEHLSTAVSYHNLAIVYAILEKHQSALNYCVRAYKIFICRCGLNHPDTQVVYRNMKYIYLDWGVEEKFEKWLDRQLE